MDEDKKLEKRTCPACGANVIAQARFCAKCGFEMSPDTQSEAAEEPEVQVVVKKIHKTENNELEAAGIIDKSKETAAVKVKYTEPENLFAKDLPEWSIEPPVVAVRRKKI